MASEERLGGQDGYHRLGCAIILSGIRDRFHEDPQISEKAWQWLAYSVQFEELAELLGWNPEAAREAALSCEKPRGSVRIE